MDSQDNNYFLTKINNATSINELNAIEKEIEKKSRDEIKTATGYEFAKDVPSTEFSSWRKKWNEILEKYNYAPIIYTKKESLSPSHLTTASGENHGGKRKTYRKRKYKSRIRKNRRKSCRFRK